MKAVDGVSLDVDRREILGLVGESGCGKSTLCKSVIRVLPANAEIKEGKVLFQGRDLIRLDRKELDKLRWKEISIVSQSSMNALDPVYNVGSQIVEAIRAHKNIDDEEAVNRVCELFELVGIESSRLRDYPHQLSGGMKQRVIIAMALALDPTLIIFDEATTALDVIVQEQILRRVEELQRQFGFSIIMVTHNISVVARTCQRVAVMYAGKIVEHSDLFTIFDRGYHPYTLGLQRAFSSVEGPIKDLIHIPGHPPNLLYAPQGCRFQARCPFSATICSQEPNLVEVEPGHFVACHMIDSIDEVREKARDPETWLKRT